MLLSLVIPCYNEETVLEISLNTLIVVDTVINMQERNRFNRALVSWLGFNFERLQKFYNVLFL